MSVDDNDELAYLWTTIKFVKRYMTKNTGSNLEDLARVRICYDNLLFIT